MIERLRRKFIWINMSLVALVLFIVFGVAVCSTAERQRMDSELTLRRMLDRPMGAAEPRPAFDRGPRRENMLLLPAFSVVTGEDGAILETSGFHATIPDAIILEAVEAALAIGEETGVIRALGLRYLMRPEGAGHRLAFVDRSNELSVLRGQALISLGVGALGLLAFFVISLFLSRWAIRPIARSFEQQRQFVADASHELKTPLTVILANMEILLSQPSLGKQSKWIENTRAEAMRMKRLVDDLLFLAKADAVSAAPVMAEQNFSDLVWSVLLPFESLAFERGVELAADIPPGFFVLGSENRLKQILAILLDNGCKYARPGTTVAVALKQRQGWAALTIKNDGPVIPPDDLPHIFERFYRADKSRGRDEGGYGLGLAIAAAIAREHKAKLTAESSEEGVTVFTLSLELAR